VHRVFQFRRKEHEFSREQSFGHAATPIQDMELRNISRLARIAGRLA